jgi:hypothetical protein
MADFKPSQVSGDVNATIEGISLTEYNKIGSAANVPASTLTTIVTQGFVSGTFENLTMVSVSGEDYAKFYIVINTVTVDVRRSGPDRNLTFNYTGAPYKLNSGDVVDVKVEHFVSGSLIDFDATIYGYSS